MIALVQRVLKASVTINSELIDSIEGGLLIFLGIRQEDDENESKYLALKTINLRIFNDENNKMNLSLIDTSKELLIVSQFTLHADTQHGNRPSFTDSCEPVKAEILYNYYINECKRLIGHQNVKQGKFGAMMKVNLINDGPVTLLLKSKIEYK